MYGKKHYLFFNEAENYYVAWIRETGRLLVEVGEGITEKPFLELTKCLDRDRGVAVRKIGVFTSSFTWNIQCRLKG